jgi:hypothetical protein
MLVVPVKLVIRHGRAHEPGSGVSVALSEAEVHWRAFLDSLIERGLRGVKFIASDDHAGLKAVRKAMFPAMAAARGNRPCLRSSCFCWQQLAVMACKRIGQRGTNATSAPFVRQLPKKYLQ